METFFLDQKNQNTNYNFSQLITEIQEKDYCVYYSSNQLIIYDFTLSNYLLKIVPNR